MSKLKDKIKSATVGDWINTGCCVISLCLLIAGFCLPPPGIIDNSVLIAVGELGVFATITRIPDWIKSVKDGKHVKLEKGDMKIEIDSEVNDNNTN